MDTTEAETQETITQRHEENIKFERRLRHLFFKYNSKKLSLAANRIIVSPEYTSRVDLLKDIIEFYCRTRALRVFSYTCVHWICLVVDLVEKPDRIRKDVAWQHLKAAVVYVFREIGEMARRRLVRSEYTRLRSRRMGMLLDD